MTKIKTQWKSESVTLLGGEPLPEDIREGLEKGPKFCAEPKQRELDKLSNIPDIATKARENDRPRCVADCVGVLLKRGLQCKRKMNVSCRSFPKKHVKSAGLRQRRRFCRGS